MQQWDTEDVETVAGVVRLLRRAAELSWNKADADGPRSPHQLFAVGIDAAADEAANLLPRRVRLDGPTPVGHNPAELLGAAGQLLRRICTEDPPTHLNALLSAGFRADLGGELRCRRVIGAP
jgi:hypothetical protein